MMNSKVYLMLIVQKCRQLQQIPQTSWQYKNNYKQINKMYYLYLLLKKREELAKRRFWVRPIFTEERRLLQGFSNIYDDYCNDALR